MSMKRLFQWLLLAVVLMLSAACAHQPSTADAKDSAGLSSDEARAFSQYRVGADDRLQINVWKNEDLSVDVPVRPDGKISVPLIGDVDAGGHTPEEVGRMVEKRLAEYIRDPHVTVIVTDLNSQKYLSRVQITGAVQQPKSVQYHQGMNVLDLVLEAGGLTKFANGSDAILYRRSDGKTLAFDVDVTDILESGKLETNRKLRPGDVLTVPESLF